MRACAVCGSAIDHPAGQPGRPPVTCSPVCRFEQRARQRDAAFFRAIAREWRDQAPFESDPAPFLARARALEAKAEAAASGKPLPGAQLFAR